MIYVGLDPSFKRTGVALYKDGVIYIDECGIEANSDKSFEQVYADTRRQVSQVVSKIKTYVQNSDEGVVVMSECPPPRGLSSPMLYGLDVLLFTVCMANGWTVYRLYPTFILHVHGKRKYNKSESVVIANKLLDGHEWKLGSKRFSHDEAEAVIFLFHNLVMSNVLSKDALKGYVAISDRKSVKLFLSNT